MFASGKNAVQKDAESAFGVFVLHLLILWKLCVL